MKFIKFRKAPGGGDKMSDAFYQYQFRSAFPASRASRRQQDGALIQFYDGLGEIEGKVTPPLADARGTEVGWHLREASR